MLREDLARSRPSIFWSARDYGESVWESLLHAGHEFRSAPFGLEALELLGGLGMMKLFRKERMWRTHELQSQLRRRDRRRGRAWAGHCLLPGKASRRSQRRAARKRLPGLRQQRPQHRHHPLELPHARRHSVLRCLRQALRGAVAGTGLECAVQPVRPSDAGATRIRPSPACACAPKTISCWAWTAGSSIRKRSAGWCPRWT